MSALGQKRTLPRLNWMSALPPKADIAERNWDVRFVPKADIPSESRALALSAQWSKARVHFFRKELRLFPGGIVPAFVERVVMSL